MSENSWPENDSSQGSEYGAIHLPDLLGDVIALESEDCFESSPLDDGFEGRRLKSALLLAGAWSLMYLVHIFTYGLWLMSGLSCLMAIHLLRAFVATPKLETSALEPGMLVDNLMPIVTLLVSAKNEEAVIEGLVRNLCNLDYPSDRYELWIVDDASSDRTAEILTRLRGEFPQLNLFRRATGASGGKSGALNQVFTKTKGEF